MSDTTDLEQTHEYEEQILDDLDDIKGSLDEESEYYDKEYQKKVLGSLRNIEKSLETDNVETLDFLETYINSNYANSGTSSSVKFVNYGTQAWHAVYDVSNIIDFNISCENTNNVTYFFLSNESVDVVKTYTVGTYSGNFLGYVSYGHPQDFTNNGYHYLYANNGGSLSSGQYPTVTYVNQSSGGDDPLPEEPVEVVTTSSAVIIEGLDNLTQITTFQSFCSSLLIGIMLFLVFVKGLRK